MWFCGLNPGSVLVRTAPHLRIQLPRVSESIHAGILARGSAANRWTDTSRGLLTLTRAMRTPTPAPASTLTAQAAFVQAAKGDGLRTRLAPTLGSLGLGRAYSDGGWATSKASSDWSRGGSGSYSRRGYSRRDPVFEPRPEHIVYGIMAVYTAVFFAWQYAIQQHKKGDSAWLQFMHDNFLSNWQSLEAGRWWTTITCAFSHNTLIHIGLNMFAFYNFADATMAILGPSRFLVFFLAAGAVSSAAHLMYTRFVEPRVKTLNASHMYGRNFVDRSSHGASGAVSAALLLFALQNPSSPIQIFFLLQMPAIVGVGGFLAYDLYMASTGQQGTVDSAAHVGGALFGLLYWAAFVRGARRF
ncbi:hypothetical protein BC830DRAFT_1095960 [Chytriomyces sp. MP71]|nr:hypothetical protein BC830DRAFT_1095960 [Chytriomyces sp. MP71]